MLSFLRSRISSMSTHWKLSIMQSLTPILIMRMWFGLKIPMLWIECLSCRKRPWELLVFSQEIVIISPLFKNQNLLKFEDKIQLENVLLVSKYFNNILPLIFDKWFTLCSDIHYNNTAAFSTGKLFKPSFRSNLYWQNSITISAVNTWNKIQTAFGNTIWKNLTTSQIKTLLTKKCFEKNALTNISLNINGKTMLIINVLLLLLLLLLILLLLFYSYHYHYYCFYHYY